MKKSMKQRLEKYNIDPETLCWNWYGAHDKQGYGRVGPKCAHRVSYEEYVGKIPPDMFVLHKCDNTKCINPDHLSIGTHQDNVDDKMRKGRHNAGKGNSKITEEQVNIIRCMAPTHRICEIAKITQINYSTISDVIHGRTWKNK